MITKGPLTINKEGLQERLVGHDNDDGTERFQMLIEQLKKVVGDTDLTFLDYNKSDRNTIPNVNVPKHDEEIHPAGGVPQSTKSSSSTRPKIAQT